MPRLTNRLARLERTVATAIAEDPSRAAREEQALCRRLGQDPEAAAALDGIACLCARRLIAGIPWAVDDETAPLIAIVHAKIAALGTQPQGEPRCIA